MLGLLRAKRESGGTHHADEGQPNEIHRPRDPALNRLRIQGRAGRTGGIRRSTDDDPGCRRGGQAGIGADSR